MSLDCKTTGSEVSDYVPESFYDRLTVTNLQLEAGTAEDFTRT